MLFRKVSNLVSSAALNCRVPKQARTRNQSPHKPIGWLSGHKNVAHWTDCGLRIGLDHEVDIANVVHVYMSAHDEATKESDIGSLLLVG
jgi:hypothetical protein